MPGMTTAFAEGVAASRPAAATTNAGYLWYSTDTQILSQSNGSSWTQIAAGVALDALTTKGDLLTRTSSAYARLGVGSNDQVLTADSTASNGIKWAAVAGGYTDPLTTRGDLVVRGASSTGRLALGTSGYYLKSDGTDATWAAAASGALTQIAQTTLGSAAANITFSSIAGSYSALMLMLVARGDTAATVTNVRAQFNADTTSGNYGWTYEDWYAGSTADGTETTSDTAITCGRISAANALANRASIVTIDLPGYAGTTFLKPLDARYALFNGAAFTTGSARLAGIVAGEWNSTAAITSIKLFPAAGNFVTGTVATLYGIL